MNKQMDKWRERYSDDDDDDLAMSVLHPSTGIKGQSPLSPFVGLGCKLKKACCCTLPNNKLISYSSLLMSSWQISIKQHSKHRSWQDLSSASLGIRYSWIHARQQESQKGPGNLVFPRKSSNSDECHSLSSCEILLKQKFIEGL